MSDKVQAKHDEIVARMEAQDRALIEAGFSQVLHVGGGFGGSMFGGVDSVTACLRCGSLIPFCKFEVAGKMVSPVDLHARTCYLRAEPTPDPA